MLPPPAKLEDNFGSSLVEGAPMGGVDLRRILGSSGLTNSLSSTCVCIP